MGGTSLFLFFVTPPTERERERERESPQGETLIGCQVLNSMTPLPPRREIALSERENTECTFCT